MESSSNGSLWIFSAFWRARVYSWLTGVVRGYFTVARWDKAVWQQGLCTWEAEGSLWLLPSVRCRRPSRDLHTSIPAEICTPLCGQLAPFCTHQPGSLVVWWHLASSRSCSIWLEAIPRGWDWLPERGAVLGGTGSPLGVRTSCSQMMGARAAKPCWWPLLLPTEQLGGWGRSRPQRRAAWCCLYSAVPAAGRQHPLGILTQGRGISGCRKGKESLGRTRTVSSCGSVSGRLHLVARLVLKLLRSWEWSKEHPLHPPCPAGLRPL